MISPRFTECQSSVLGSTYQPTERTIMTTTLKVYIDAATILMPVSCDEHNVIAIVDSRGADLYGVVALYCEDCDETYEEE